MEPAAHPRHALVRADASGRIGAGHLGRCLTLAEALRAAGVTVVFLMAGDEFLPWVTQRGFPARTITGSPGSEDDLGETRDLARGERHSLVVVDGYHFSTAYSKALHDSSLFTCCIDDLGDKPFACDLVLNGNVHAAKLHYQRAPYCEVLLGPMYALVRNEFLEARSLREAPRADARRVLVTLGAADPDGWTERVLMALAEIGQPLEVRVVLGLGNARGYSVRDRACSLQQRHHVEVLQNVANMAESMLWCDAAVTAGGTTCLELACVGVPSVTLAVSDNQRPGTEELDRLGLMRAVSELSVEGIAREVDHVLRDFSLRSLMAKRQRETIDGQGKYRAVRHILERVGSREGSR